MHPIVKWMPPSTTKPSSYSIDRVVYEQTINKDRDKLFPSFELINKIDIIEGWVEGIEGREVIWEYKWKVRVEEWVEGINRWDGKKNEGE